MLCYAAAVTIVLCSDACMQQDQQTSTDLASAVLRSSCCLLGALVVRECSAGGSESDTADTRAAVAAFAAAVLQQPDAKTVSASSGDGKELDARRLALVAAAPSAAAAAAMCGALQLQELDRVISDVAGVANAFSRGVAADGRLAGAAATSWALLTCMRERRRLMGTGSTGDQHQVCRALQSDNADSSWCGRCTPPWLAMLTWHGCDSPFPHPT